MRSASITCVRTQLLATAFASPAQELPTVLSARETDSSVRPEALSTAFARPRLHSPGHNCLRLLSPGHDCIRPATTVLSARETDSSVRLEALSTAFARLRLHSPGYNCCRPTAQEPLQALSTTSLPARPPLCSTRQKDPRHRPNSPAISRPARRPARPVTPTTAFNSPAHGPAPAHRPHHTAKKDLLALQPVLRHPEQGYTASLSGKLSPIVPHSTTQTAPAQPTKACHTSESYVGHIEAANARAFGPTGTRRSMPCPRYTAAFSHPDPVLGPGPPKPDPAPGTTHVPGRPVRHPGARRRPLGLRVWPRLRAPAL